MLHKSCLDDYKDCSEIYFWDSTLTNLPQNILYIKWLDRIGNYRKIQESITALAPAFDTIHADDPIYRLFEFHQYLNLYKTNDLTLTDLDSVISSHISGTPTQIDLLNIKSNFLERLGNKQYSFATGLYAEHLSKRLSETQIKSLYYPPGIIHAINVHNEHYHTNKSAVRHFLKRTFSNDSRTPKDRWMKVLYHTVYAPLPAKKIEVLKQLYIDTTQYAPITNKMIETHLAYSTADTPDKINRLKQNITLENENCNYNRLYLIDAYLENNNIESASQELSILEKCAPQMKNIFTTIYYYRLQKYLYTFYQSKGNLDHLRMAMDVSDKIITSYNDFSTEIINEHYADVIYHANNILVNGMYELSKQNLPLNRNKTLEHLQQIKALYQQISGSKNFLKGSINPSLMDSIAELKYHIEINEVKTNRYIDTIITDLSIYAQLYNDHSNLHALISRAQKHNESTNVTPTLDKIDIEVAAEDQILEFVKTDEAYFLFSIDAKTITINRINLNSFETAIKLQVQQFQNKTESLVASQLLIDFISSNVKPHTKHLYILPDGALTNLPIEALRTKSDKLFIDKLQISYLTNIENYAQLENDTLPSEISLFSYSDTVTLQDRSQKAVPELKVGFDEVFKISTLYETSTTIHGPEFTIDKTLEQADKSILHFSSHAYSSSSNLLDNYIYTRSTQGIEEPLYGFHLKNTSFENNLIILSSCNSGTGVQKPGTGVFSLSRDFLQAGAQTVIKSLWAVNEASTKELMVEMHRNFTCGQSIGESLTNAKRTVKKMPGYEHPYYWAGFVLEGNPHVYLDLTDQSNN